VDTAEHAAAGAGDAVEDVPRPRECHDEHEGSKTRIMRAGRSGVAPPEQGGPSGAKRPQFGPEGCVLQLLMQPAQRVGHDAAVEQHIAITDAEVEKNRLEMRLAELVAALRQAQEVTAAEAPDPVWVQSLASSVQRATHDLALAAGLRYEDEVRPAGVSDAAQQDAGGLAQAAGQVGHDAAVKQHVAIIGVEVEKNRQEMEKKRMELVAALQQAQEATEAEASSPEWVQFLASGIRRATHDLVQASRAS
jgi:hypothetical protein